MEKSRKDLLVKSFDYLFKKIDDISEKLDDVKFKYKNKTSKYLKKSCCPITGDYWSPNIIGIPIGESDGKIKYYHMFGRALDMYSPDDLVETTLIEYYQRFNEHHKNNSKKNRIFSKKEILKMIDKWEYIELGKINGFSYLGELEDKVSSNLSSEYKAHLMNSKNNQSRKKSKR